MTPSTDRRPAAAGAGATRLFRRCVVGVTVVFAIASLAWLPFSNIHIDLSNFREALVLLAALAAAWLAGQFVLRRHGADTKPLGRLLCAFAAGLMTFVGACVLLVPFGFFSGLFMYLASATEAPLLDAQLAAIDAALGFDWQAFLAWANARPLLAAALVFAYHSTGPLLVAEFVYFSFARREERLYELFALIALTTLCTAFIQALVPAAGAYVLFQPGREQFSNFTELAGMWHYAELAVLRAGEPFTYFTANSSGMVTFPSFHTVLGVLTAYAVRDERWLAPPILLLNATMIVATIPEGGHHLIDVFAGFAIAATAILALRRVAAAVPAPATPRSLRTVAEAG